MNISHKTLKQQV